MDLETDISMSRLVNRAEILKDELVETQAQMVEAKIQLHHAATLAQRGLDFRDEVTKVHEDLESLDPSSDRFLREFTRLMRRLDELILSFGE